MGTKMSPSYANIFMGILEKQMLSTYPHKPFIYFCYIDDIFMIWTDGEDSSNTFLEHCNKQNQHIKFKQTGTGTTVPFLDVSVTLKNRKLHSDLYRKPTDKHQYLYYTSCHPKHTKNSLPYCLVLRLCRICSTEHLFSLHTDDIKQHLRKRGYTKGCINDAINKASQVPRREAIMKKLEQNKTWQSPICHHIQHSTTKHSKTPTRISNNPKCFRKMFWSFQKYSFSELQEREELKWHALQQKNTTTKRYQEKKQILSGD